MKTVILSLLLALFAGCLAGCAAKDTSFDQRQQHLAGALDALRLANFNGQFRFNEGGSPLGLNAATNWSLGPQQMTVSVEGTVDFTKPPRAPSTADTAPGNESAKGVAVRSRRKVVSPTATAKIETIWDEMAPEERVAFLNSPPVKGMISGEPEGITPPPKLKVEPK